MGWGIAIGTAIGYAIGGSIIISYLIRGRFHLKLQLNKMKPKLAIISRLLTIGPWWYRYADGSFSNVVSIDCQFNGKHRRSGAWYGYSNRGLSLPTGTCLWGGGNDDVGQFLVQVSPRVPVNQLGWPVCGRKCHDVCRPHILLCADTITSLFAGENTEAGMAAPLIRIVSLSMPSLAIVIIMTGALRGQETPSFL